MYTWSFAMTLPLCSGCGRPSGSHSSLTNDTPTTRGPASTGTRTSKPGVSRDLHVLFPFGIAGKTWFAIAGITRRGGPALGSASDREPLQQLAVEANIELLRPTHALEVILILPLKTNLDEVLAVDRKVVANRDAATRSERQIFALPVVLQHVQRNLECLDPRTGGRKTRRKSRNLARHRHVSFQVRGRNREDIREIVETAVRCLIAGQQRLHIELEREQIANRVVVFRAIETMDRADPCRDSDWPPTRDRFRFRANSPRHDNWPHPGRGLPGGGIEPARSFAITRSHTSAFAPGLVASKLSSASPAVRSFWLWQLMQ